MYQGGDEDIFITPTVRAPGGAYSPPPPKNFIEFARAGHLAWADVGIGCRNPPVTMLRNGVTNGRLSEWDSGTRLLGSISIRMQPPGRLGELLSQHR